MEHRSNRFHWPCWSPWRSLASARARRASWRPAPRRGVLALSAPAVLEVKEEQGGTRKNKEDSKTRIHSALALSNLLTIKLANEK